MTTIKQLAAQWGRIDEKIIREALQKDIIRFVERIEQKPDDEESLRQVITYIKYLLST